MLETDLSKIIPDDLKDLILNNNAISLQVDNTGNTTLLVDGEKLSKILIPSVEISKYALTINVTNYTLLLDKKQELTFNEYTIS